jgi:hypothetical protein
VENHLRKTVRKIPLRVRWKKRKNAKSDETGDHEDPVMVLGRRPKELDGPTFCPLDNDV